MFSGGCLHLEHMPDLLSCCLYLQDDLHDQVRASVEDGRLVHHVKPPIYAGDPLHQKGDLIFTIFGQEMVDKMCLLGFNVTAHRLHNGAHGILGNNAWVFVATKPAEPG